MKTAPKKQRGRAAAAPAESVIPAMPMPQAEHEWLMQFVGEWDSKTETHMDPDGPPEMGKAVERVRALGGFWIVAEVDTEMMGMPFRGIQTLGYDPKKQVFVGTWVDSMSSAVWTCEGRLNKDRNILTLYAEGECPAMPGKLTRVKDVLEIQGRDHKIYSSYILDTHGDWTLCMEARGVRRK